MKESVSSKMIKVFLRLFRVKKVMQQKDPDKFFKLMSLGNNFVGKSAPKTTRKHVVELVSESIVKLTPKDSIPGKIIIFSNGGAWAGTINCGHWKMLKKLSSLIKTTIYVSKYPLIPKYNGDDLRRELLKNYLAIEKNHKDDKIILMGDSAGGYNSVLLYELLKNENCNKPHKLILLSPCLDINLEVQIDAEVDKNDPILSVQSGGVIFEKIKGSLDANDPILNPTKYVYSREIEIDIYTGSYDILHEQAINFYNVKKDEAYVHLYTFNKMIHDFVMFGVKESRLVLKQIEEDFSTEKRESFRKEMLND